MLSKTRKTKRLISIILAAATALGIMLFSPAASAGSSGGFTYTVENGEATITGFSGSGAVTIPSEIDGIPVTTIGMHSFFAKKAVTSVVIPDSVKTIDDYAFLSCSSLRSVTIGDGVTSIGMEAFHACSALKDLKIGKNVKTIGGSAFSPCESLEEVVIPDSVEVIDTCCFYWAKSLKKVTLGKGVSQINSYAFSACPELPEITIDPENESFVSVDRIVYSKDGTKLVWIPYGTTQIEIPENVTVIGDSAFAFIETIRNLTVPDNVTEIGDNAYSGCNTLTDLLIPDSVTKVGMAAFSYITSLKRVTFGSGLKIIPGFIFAGCESLTDLRIPDGVTEIGKRAFYNCTSLKRITIPESVTAIGQDAFGRCYSLADIYFDGTQTEWDSISVDADVPSGVKVHFGENPPQIDDPPVIDPPVVDPPVVDPPADDEPTVSFSDVKAGAFYADAVAWAVKKGITSGTSKTTFSPDNGCTRGQVVTFLWRAAGSPEPKSGKNPFSDVKTDDYFFKAVLWATENGITAGTGKTTFSPSSVCTRGQIVTFLWRAAGSPEPKSGKNPFSDVGADDYFFKAVLWAVEEGITKGTGAHAFSPASPCTRGQIVTFLYRNMG